MCNKIIFKMDDEYIKLKDVPIYRPKNLER